MCGVVGLWNLDGEPVDRDALDCFTDSLEHRGPDGRGVFIDSQASFGLGHRRLSILDTSEAAAQPMGFRNGRYWISFNGEIYNFLELRSELEENGYRFTTNSDTEVVLAGYERWGEDCQLRFNGMWAFAIWDSRERRLFLSRDRFGVKPLHYYFDGKRFAFGSEMKSFLALGWFSRTFDLEVVRFALTHSEEIEGTEQCLLRDLKRLSGGYCLVLSAGGSPKLRRWWNTLDHLEMAPRRYEDQVARYRELFFDACRIRMRSDVPLGTSLSGGLDSSSALCSMSHIRRGVNGGERLAVDWQKAFIATYPGTSQDETEYADEVVRFARVEPEYCEVTPLSLVDHFSKVVFQYEELSDIAIGPWMVYQRQRARRVLVSIDGHGGDELLGGYHHHVEQAIWDAMLHYPRFQLKELRQTMRNLYLNDTDCSLPTYSAAIRSYGRESGSRLRSAVRSFLGRSRATDPFGSSEKPQAFLSPIFEQDKALLRHHDALFRLLYRDFHCTHLPTNLRDYDRLSMAHGVEVRSPFMDWRLACYAFSLPSSTKIGGGYTKRILRDAMKDVLPERIRTRTRKVGFANPSKEWVTAPVLKPMILDSIACKEFQESAVWDGKRIAENTMRAYEGGDPTWISIALRCMQAMFLMNAFQHRGVRR